MTALCGICSQFVHQLVCSNFSARKSQHLASLVSIPPVFGVLVCVLKHASTLIIMKVVAFLLLFSFFFLYNLYVSQGFQAQLSMCYYGFSALFGGVMDDRMDKVLELYQV